MIQEKSTNTQILLDSISSFAGKVNFISDAALTESLRHLEIAGIPTNKHEDYKYCNLDAVLKREFKTLKAPSPKGFDIKQYKLEDTITLVVLNGNYNESLSDKIILKGLHISSFNNLSNAEKLQLTSLTNINEDAFVSLNTAFSGLGFFLTVEKNTSLQIPIHILYINDSETETMVQPRNFICLQQGASATIIEHFINANESKVFTNFVSEKQVAANANLNVYSIQDEGKKGFSINTNQVQVARDGNYTNTTITLSGQVVRNNHNVVLAESNSQAHLFGLFKINDTQLVDNHTLMDHRVPHCESNELYKGIIDGKSTGVFNGKIYVRKDAQKTNAYQSSKNILLSDDATINTKPQLEIYADDVKCSHGTSTGKIDEQALFYLNARGIGRESASRLLLQAFAGEVSDKIEVDSARNLIEEKLGYLS
jgi:Fe-S cluster assembly protein SufD